MTFYFHQGFPQKEGRVKVMQLLSEGKIRIKPLITHVFSFQEAKEVYRLVLEKPQEVLGVTLKWED